MLDALQNPTTYTYDALGNETSVTDALEHTITRSFDPTTGKQLTELDPLNNRTTYAYEGSDRNLVSSTTDARGNITHYSYAGTAPTLIAEPLGRTSGLGYNAKGNLTRLDIAGRRTTYTYDDDGNRLTETDAAGNVTSFTYDANGREISRSYQRTKADATTETITLSRTLDAEGRVLTETDPLGGLTRTEYNSAGKPTRVTDAQGRVTTYSYDALARLTRTTYPDESFEATEYDANGNEIARTDRAGRVTRFTFDALDRLTRTTDPDGSFTATEYDALGRVTAEIDARGNRTSHEYDAAGRRTATVEPGTGRWRFAYDANGNRIKTTDPLGRETAFTYDALNRLTLTTYPDGSTRGTEWRPDGLKSAETFETGNTVQYGYDALGRLTSVTETLAAGELVTAYTYDELGNKLSQTDAEGRITRWSFDAAGRPLTRTLPDGQTEAFSYDLGGNLTRHVDFNGEATQYAYDSLGRLTLTLYPDGSSLALTYSADGQVASTTDALGTTTWSYDLAGRPLKKTLPDDRFIGWAYDADGRITERSSPAGTVRYTFDANGRLATVTDPAGRITGYTWNTAGELIRVHYPNGTETRSEYDPNGRISQKAHLRTSSGELIAATRYTYTGGQRSTVEVFDGASSAIEVDGQLQLANPVRSTAYTYDALQRLTGESLTLRGSPETREIAYVYDAVGNRSRRTVTIGASTLATDYTFDANDRLSTETRTDALGNTSTTRYAWDDNGNLASKTTPGEVTLYGWDSENRLIEVKRGADEASASTVATYAYDADGLRIRRTEPGSPPRVTDYLTDPSFPFAQVLEESETIGTATETTHYVWGAELLEQIRGGQGTFYHADALGSVKALTDEAGETSDLYEYEAFGELASHAGASDNAYRYTGEYFDGVMGLQYNRARWYSADVGRWTAMDPHPGVMGRPASLNRYVYAEQVPTVFADPSGELIFFTLGGNVNISSRTAAFNSTRVAINRTAGKAFERAIGRRLQSIVDRLDKDITIHRQVFVDGPGGRRFADFALQAGNQLILIEVKTKIPLGGRALTRFAGQLRSYISPRRLGSAANPVKGQVNDVWTFTLDDMVTAQRSLNSIGSKLATGQPGPVVQGSVEMIGLLVRITFGL